MILPFVVGCGLGAGGMALMHRIGLLAERSGVVILVCAIAAFYPVFSLAAGAGIGTTLFHFSVFAGFAAAAAWGFHAGAVVLAGLLILHGLFDAVAIFVGSPAPQWWPPFCAGVDITAGAFLLFLIRTKGISA